MPRAQVFHERVHARQSSAHRFARVMINCRYAGVETCRPDYDNLPFISMCSREKSRENNCHRYRFHLPSSLSAIK
jgi:hypothetical protein